MALDAYRNMAAQGLAPAATTFKAVLTALLQRGAFEEADGVLATLAGQLQSSGGGGRDAPGAEVCPPAPLPAMQLWMQNGLFAWLHASSPESQLSCSTVPPPEPPPAHPTPRLTSLPSPALPHLPAAL